MSTVVSILPKGTHFARFAMALMRSSGDIPGALELSTASWGDTLPTRVLRAAVAVGTTTDPTWASPLVDYRLMMSDFIEALRPATIVGRLTSMRRVPFNVRVPRVTIGSGARWVGEGKPIPVTRASIDNLTSLKPYRIAGIIVTTRDLVRMGGPAAEAVVTADLVSGVASFSDQSFMDPAHAAEDAVSPASITHGAPSFASSGTTLAAILADLGKLIGAVADATPFVAPTWIMSTKTATKLGLVPDSTGAPAFNEIGPRGGLLLNIPVIASAAVADGVITLIDASELVIADDGDTLVDASESAAIEISDTPTGEGQLTSLWQHNLVGLKANRVINWEWRRAGAVACLTGLVL